ncbi:MAG: porin family protein [Flavisolibacter sp.]
MKKISLMVIALFATATVFAQSAKFGLKGGLNVSTLSNDQGSEMGSRLGVHAGLLAHIHLSKQFALQPEVVYSSQGAKYTVSDGEHSLGLNYINVPLQLQYMFDNGFRIQTGPQVGFLASVNDKRDGTETGFFTSDDFKSVDFSWSAGLGYLTYSGFGVDARYNFGLNNINDAGSAVRRNNVFQVGVFYMFNNNHKATSR